MNRCEKCGFMHYRTEPCRASKPVEPTITPKPKRSVGRPKTITDMKAYKAKWARDYRARKALSSQPQKGE